MPGNLRICQNKKYHEICVIMNVFEICFESLKIYQTFNQTFKNNVRLLCHMRYDKLQKNFHEMYSLTEVFRSSKEIEIIFFTFAIIN